MGEQFGLKAKLKSAAFWLLIFIVLYVFFAAAHPFYVFDADDWLYISGRRWGLPLWGYWNPTKVLPEVLMPYTAEAAIRLVKPFVHDYLLSITYTWAALFAALITAYVYEVSRLISQKFSLEGVVNYTVSLFFLLMHFLIFKKGPENNIYLFHTQSMNISFNYTIPALVNAVLVLYLIRNDRKRISLVKRGVVGLIAYLCVFSNLFHSIVLVSYAGFCLLREISAAVRNKKAIRAFFSDTAFYWFVMVLWVIQCIFELSGGRASEMTRKVNMAETVGLYFGWIRRSNMFFLLIIAGISAAFVFFYAKASRKKAGPDEAEIKESITMCLFCFAAVSLFLIAVCAVVSPGYIVRADVIISADIYFMYMYIMIMAYLIKKSERLFVMVPLVCFVSLTVTTNGLKLFADYNIHDLRGKECLPVSRDLVNQVLEREAGGFDTVTLHVPVWEGNDGNWPHDVNCLGERMANTLYRHGMTDKLMKIEVVPDPDYIASKETNYYYKK